MTNVCVHGLGQTDKSWDKVKGILNQDNINKHSDALIY